jgi:hypothetical protein
MLSLKMAVKPEHVLLFIYLFIYLFSLTANGFVPGGSGTTIRHNTQSNTHRTK